MTTDRSIGLDDPVLAEIVRRLVDAVQPARIYLFGSRARGVATEDSDYDGFVLVNRPLKNCATATGRPMT
jgi:predicted nucleotidyltransferase